MAERRAPAPPYPLTADLAGVLAMAQQERTETLWRVLRLCCSAPAGVADRAVAGTRPWTLATAVR